MRIGTRTTSKPQLQIVRLPFLLLNLFKNMHILRSSKQSIGLVARGVTRALSVGTDIDSQAEARSMCKQADAPFTGFSKTWSIDVSAERAQRTKTLLAKQTHNLVARDHYLRSRPSSFTGVRRSEIGPAYQTFFEELDKGRQHNQAI